MHRAKCAEFARDLRRSADGDHVSTSESGVLAWYAVRQLVGIYEEEKRIGLIQNSYQSRIHLALLRFEIR
jgi:hypothetical protein